jgi:hypothetical protein
MMAAAAAAHDFLRTYISFAHITTKSIARLPSSAETPAG